MGWSKGKGLGANLDGEQNFIKVSHKADQKGIGFEDRDDQWTEHENQFNSLLKSLDNSAAPSENEDNAEDDADELSAMSFRGFGFADAEEKPSKKKKESIMDTLSGKSLEEMSKNSKSRVHYKKFTRGKDLSKYSEKDLANIFGKKVTDEEIEKNPLADEAEKLKNVDLPLSNYGITTIDTGTTISDYFHKKKTNLLKRSGAVLDSSSNSPSPNEEDSQEPEKRRKKKKKDKSEERTALVTAEVVDLVDEVETKREKKSKKKREKVGPVEVIELGDDDVEDAPLEEPSSKKKNKKKKEKREPETDGPTQVDATIFIDDSSATKVKKKKSKKLTEAIEVEELATTAEVTTTPSPIISNILSTLIFVNNADDSPTVQEANGSVTTTGTESSKSSAANLLQFAEETFEINRYQAELFRFVDLDGFKSANLSDLTGYGFGKNIDLKITARTQDRNRINDLWDNALINKYGKDVIKAKKKQKYSLKTLKNKKLFKAI